MCAFFTPLWIIIYDCAVCTSHEKTEGMTKVHKLTKEQRVMHLQSERERRENKMPDSHEAKEVKYFH